MYVLQKIGFLKNCSNFNQKNMIFRKRQMICLFHPLNVRVRPFYCPPPPPPSPSPWRSLCIALFFIPRLFPLLLPHPPTLRPPEPRWRLLFLAHFATVYLFFSFKYLYWSKSWIYGHELSSLCMINVQLQLHFELITDAHIDHVGFCGQPLVADFL